MKRTLQILSLSTLAIMSYGCNEKISPELEDANSTTTTTVIPPTTYYFEITNKSPAVLNYVLHRTGVGNASTPCRIESTTAFDSQGFRDDKIINANWDSRVKDISCFMEAEELALHFNGASFAVGASKNTCEYIGYSPYSFYNAIPGSSSGTYQGVVCNNVSNADASAKALADGWALYGATASTCDQMVNTDILTVNRAPFDTMDLQSLCKYDYSYHGGGNGKNCDTGVITYRLDLISDDTDPLTPANPQRTQGVVRTHNCGGKISNCVGGPILKVDGGSNSTLITEVLSSEVNTEYQKTYSLEALMGRRSAQHDIVNYRRGLANAELDFQDYFTPTTWFSIFNKAYDPSVIANFSANTYPDGTTRIISSAEHAAIATAGVTSKRTPLAADPFLGLSSRVNPFYTFYCFDRAFETKARIRLVIRDWDRVFPTNNDTLELISDAHEAEPRQDLPDLEELNGELGVSYNYFNDKDDWDNIIPMERIDWTATHASIAAWKIAFPNDHIWYPVYESAPGVYSKAWWRDDIFPKQTDD